MDFIGARFQHLGQPGQAVHGHPGAMRAALAGGAVAGGGRLVKHLARVQRAQLVHHAVVGGDYEFLRIHVVRGLQDGRGGAHRMRQRHHVGGRFGVHQHLGAGVFLHQRLQLKRLELVVHDARAVPEHHVGAGLALDVAAQVAVGCPQDLVALVFQRAHDVQRAAGRDQPVRPGLHRSAGVGIHHHGAVGVRVAERVEFLNRAAQVQRAVGVQVGHEHALLRAQDFCRFAHELHA